MTFKLGQSLKLILHIKCKLSRDCHGEKLKVLQGSHCVVQHTTVCPLWTRPEKEALNLSLEESAEVQTTGTCPQGVHWKLPGYLTFVLFFLSPEFWMTENRGPSLSLHFFTLCSILKSMTLAKGCTHWDCKVYFLNRQLLYHLFHLKIWNTLHCLCYWQVHSLPNFRRSRGLHTLPHIRETQIEQTANAKLTITSWQCYIPCTVRRFHLLILKSLISKVMESNIGLNTDLCACCH